MQVTSSETFSSNDCSHLDHFQHVVSDVVIYEREIIDQLATTGTYVTRDGDGVLRHWNGITDEYVGERTRPGRPPSYQ